MCKTFAISLFVFLLPAAGYTEISGIDLVFIRNDPPSRASINRLADEVQRQSVEIERLRLELKGRELDLQECQLGMTSTRRKK